MFKNYIKVAFRNLLRNKLYSLINTFGLAIGMALCLLILVYVRDELSYDSHHVHKDRIYRLAQTEDHNGDLVNVMRGAPGLKRRLELDFPEAIEKVVRLFPGGEVWTRFEDKLFREDQVFVADETFFEIFTFTFIAGDAEAALKEPNSLVLNRSTAVRYFGGTDIIGSMVTVDFPEAPLLEVTAVVEDSPDNSHFHPDLLVSLSTLRNEENDRFLDMMMGDTVWTYILAKSPAAVADMEARFPAFIEKHYDKTRQELIKALYLQPLRDIHLRSSTDPYTEIEPERTGNITYLYIFSLIAFLILLVACINFMNLSTARSARRAREVGLRKVVGAERRQLIRQFIGESLFIAVLALPLAVSLAQLFLPVFNSLSQKNMSIRYGTDPAIMAAMILSVIFVGLVSGSYPAFFLSAFQPVGVLKGKLSSRGGGELFRKILVVGQFAVSIGFLVSILVILRQMHFMRSSDLGFNKDNVVVLPCLLPEPPEQVRAKMDVLKNEFRNHPAVVEVALTSGAPSDIRGIVRGRLKGTPAEDAKLMVLVPVDYEYLKALQIDLLEGRDFSREFATDVREAFIINPEVARELNLEEPLGKRLILNDIEGSVIGVMRSIHWEPKRRVIFPMVFQVNPEAYNRILVRLSPENISGTLGFMEEKWKESVSTRPFQYEFLDDMIENLYKGERRLGSIVLYLTILSVFIACLGLFGLASYTAEQKTKEIGIRKVLGASVSGVVILLSKQYGKLILLANIIAWPLAYYFLHRWLQNFYYRVGIGVEFFFLSAALVLMIAFVSISFQSLKAALGDPADALRYE